MRTLYVIIFSNKQMLAEKSCFGMNVHFLWWYNTKIGNIYFFEVEQMDNWYWQVQLSADYLTGLVR